MRMHYDLGPLLWAAITVLLGVGACRPPSANEADDDAHIVVDATLDTGADGPAVDAEAPEACATDEQCDDQIACTEDICGSGGVCRLTPLDARCEGEQRCVPGLGCRDPSCEGASECDDGVFCNGAERCIAGQCFDADSDRDCNDGDDCTRDFCNVGVDSCAHEVLPGCASDAGTDSSTTRPFDPSSDYSGTFDMRPAQSSGCGAATYDIRSVTMTSTADRLAVQAGPFTLEETPRPAGADFTASFVQSGCGTYVLAGTFLDSDNFTGRWLASFGEGGCWACDDQDVEIYGVRAP